MADGKYLIGESLREKLKSTIAKVDSIPFGGPVSRIPTRFEDTPTRASPLKFASFAGTNSWFIGQTRTITFLEAATDTALQPAGVVPTANAQTALAVSCLFSIPGNTSTASVATSLICVTRLNGNWQVLASIAN